MKNHVLALDQGTSSSRAIVFDHEGQMVSVSQKEFTQYFPKPGWVEHDPNEILSSVYEVMAGSVAKAGLSNKDIVAVGITNQRETTIVWDVRTGKPVYNAIVWQDRRTADYCDALKEQGLTDEIRSKTGLIIDAYFSGTKVKWILDNIPGAMKAAKDGFLRFGTVDSWLVWNLTDGKQHVTDVTNASRTMLFNINTLEWDKELLALFGIPESMMPQVRSCSEIYGWTERLGGIVPVSGMAGDQQAALFGQMCIEPGSVKNTYGTGCFLLMNTGEKPVLSANNLLTTIACQIGGKTTYALEGSVFVAGSVVKWLRDGLGIIKNSSDIRALAASVPDNGGVYFVPALTGLGAPYWNPHATGTITGITRGTVAGHIGRAAVEGIAFQTMDIVAAMERDAGVALAELKVDGGACVDDLMMQFQADVLSTKVIRPVITETTALGAAYLAGLAVGFWKDINQIRSQWKSERVFTPQTNKTALDYAAAAKEGWLKTVAKTVLN